MQRGGATVDAPPIMILSQRNIIEASRQQQRNITRNAAGSRRMPPSRARTVMPLVRKCRHGHFPDDSAS